ncbi:MAG: CvpA family protein [Rickettsiales bacterium]|nr:CvpA family protein [Rickettsiales bacterium]
MTNFDLTVYVTLLMFLFIGFFKGGIRSVLSLVKWYGAFLLSIIFYDDAHKFALEMFSSEMVASIAAILGIYIASMIVLTILSSIIVAALGDNVDGLIDKALGLFMGVAVGYIIVSSVHFVVSSVYQGDEPKWLKEGQSYEITKVGADVLKGYFKDGTINISKDLGFDFGDRASEISGKVKEHTEQLKSGVSNATGSELDVNLIKDMARKLKDQGYSEQEVLDIIQSGNTDFMGKIQENKDSVIDTIKRNTSK